MISAVKKKNTTPIPYTKRKGGRKRSVLRLVDGSLEMSSPHTVSERLALETRYPCSLCGRGTLSFDFRGHLRDAHDLILSEQRARQHFDAPLAGPPYISPSAADHYVETNIAFAVHVARQAVKGVLQDDIVRESILGLVIAAQQYDPSKAKFTTYSANWCRARVYAALVRNRSIVRFGNNYAERAVFFGHSRYADREQAARELPSKLGISEERVASAMQRLAHFDLSLDMQDLDGRSNYSAFGHDDTPEKIVGEEEGVEFRKETIRRVVRHLDSRAREIVERHYLADPPETLVEISDSMGISRQRVQQIEMRALQDLKKILLRG